MKLKILLLSLLALCSSFAHAGELDKLPQFTLNGGLRFNYNFSDWKQGSKDRGGDFGYDVLFFRLRGKYNKVLLDADYRFYSKDFGGGMLKYGWIGYQFDEKNQIQLGLTRVPFGIQPYAANNFLFQMSYYVGLEDDSDMGIKYLHAANHWEFALAFFKNADELLFSSNGETSDDRYGYDVAGRNKELNQFNGQVFYKWGQHVLQRIGASAEFGWLYNLDTRKNGTHYAFALHHELYWKGLSLKTQIATYAMNPKDAPGVPRDTIMMTAYGAPYAVAAKANLYQLGIGYQWNVNWGLLESVKIYNDFGWLQKHKKSFHDSFQNATGCMLTAGPLIAYVDYALGLHQAWLGPDWNAFAEGTGSNTWHARFNVNIGYYF